MADTNCKFSGKENVILWELSLECVLVTYRVFVSIEGLGCAIPLRNKAPSLRCTYTSRVKVSTFDLNGRACEAMIS